MASVDSGEHGLDVMVAPRRPVRPPPGFLKMLCRRSRPIAVEELLAKTFVPMPGFRCRKGG